MTVTKEHTAGWVGSILFHLLLLLLFFFVKVPELTQQEEIVEISWGGVTSVLQAAPSAQPSKGAVAELSSSDARNIAPPTQTISPPERRMPDPSEDILRVPKTEKLTLLEASSNIVDRTPSTSQGERRVEGRRTLGQKELEEAGGLGRDQGAATPSAGIHAGSAAIDRGVSFNIQWLDGGTRRKLSGDLPQYPPGVNVSAQIKILAVILPDGTVKNLQPAQKGDQKLEDVAMKEVRFWRFEPLRASQPQVDQRCEITFLFTLK
jgi:outer membrane biosynthesis protein TonB